MGPFETLPATGISGDIGVDAAGNEILVWSARVFTANETTGEVRTSGRIQASTRGSEGTWSAPVTVAETGDVHGEPRIAVSAKDAAIVAWTSLGPGNNFRVGAAARAPGGVWGEPVILTQGSAVSHDETIDSDGDGIVTWAQVTPAGSTRVWDAFATAYEPGSPPSNQTGVPRCAPAPTPARTAGTRPAGSPSPPASCGPTSASARPPSAR